MNALISSPDRGGSLTAGGVLFGYRQCRHQPDHAFGRKRSSHQTGRRAALEQRGQPCSRTERCEAVEECLREKANADRDRTLEWSRFGPCAGPKSSKAMPPPSRRGERAYPSARGLGSQLLGLPSARREFEPGLWLLRSPFPGNGISPSIRQGIKESVELWRGILKQSVSYDQVIDMRFVNEVRKRAERSTSGEISHRTGQAIEKLPATGCPTQL
jgi:hypothetical protein